MSEYIVSVNKLYTYIVLARMKRIIRESVDSLCRDGADTPIVRVHREAFYYIVDYILRFDGTFVAVDHGQNAYTMLQLRFM